MSLFSRRRTLETGAAIIEPSLSVAGFRGLGATAQVAAPTAKPAPKEKAGEKKADDDDEDMKKGAKTDPKDAKKPDDDDDEDQDDDDDEGDDDDDGDDGSDEEDMKKGSKAAAPRRRERARIARILEHPSAAANVEFALHLALNTDLGRDQVCAILAKAPAAAAGRGRLGDRMQSLANRDAGVDAPGHAGASKQQKADALWEKALAARGIVKPAA